MRLFNQNRHARTTSYGTNRHEYVPDHPTAPPWYMQEIKSKARRYQIPPTTYEHQGELIIDEVNNLVYVRLVPSYSAPQETGNNYPLLTGEWDTPPSAIQPLPSSAVPVQ